jgi:hypothetical protein
MIREDVELGLRSQQRRLDTAAVAQGFWDYDGKQFMQLYLRDAETPFDYVARPYREAGLTRQLIEILCAHLYSPGPGRVWTLPGQASGTETAGNKFLQKVYADNSIDSLMNRADQLSTLSNVAAVQVDVDEGVFQDKPVTLRLWGAEDFAVWTDPDNRTVGKVCCTVDRFETRATYRLWTDGGCYVYQADEKTVTTGNQVATFEEFIPHKYGCLPFAFVHAVQPITTFWEVGPGPLIVAGEVRCNDRLSRLDESINKHINPIPFAQNVDENWQPIIEPQRFIRIKPSMMRVGPTGGFEDGPQPLVYYLEAHIDVAGAWDDLQKFLTQILQALHIPAEAVRMEKIEASSGIALIVEQAPLLTRARARHKPFTIYETNIARTILRCAGNHYGRGELVSDAKTGSLTVAWPQPSVPVPTQDNLDLLLGQVTAGIKSLVMATMEWYGCDRECAFKILEQVELDNEELKRRAPTLALQGAGLPPPADPDDDPDEPDPDDDGAEDDEGEPTETGDDEDDEEEEGVADAA